MARRRRLMSGGIKFEFLFFPPTKLLYFFCLLLFSLFCSLLHDNASLHFPCRAPKDNLFTHFFSFASSCVSFPLFFSSTVNLLDECPFLGLCCSCYHKSVAISPPWLKSFCYPSRIQRRHHTHSSFRLVISDTSVDEFTLFSFLLRCSSMTHTIYIHSLDYPAERRMSSSHVDESARAIRHGGKFAIEYEMSLVGCDD